MLQKPAAHIIYIILQHKLTLLSSPKSVGLYKSETLTNLQKPNKIPFT